MAKLISITSRLLFYAFGSHFMAPCTYQDGLPRYTFPCVELFISFSIAFINTSGQAAMSIGQLHCASVYHLPLITNLNTGTFSQCSSGSF